MSEVITVPCEFWKADFIHPNLRGYWFRIYCLIVFLNGRFETYSFLHQFEQLDNACLLREMDICCETTSFRCLATPDNHFSEVFAMIEDYVSKADSDS